MTELFCGKVLKHTTLNGCNITVIYLDKKTNSEFVIVDYLQLDYYNAEKYCRHWWSDKSGTLWQLSSNSDEKSSDLLLSNKTGAFWMDSNYKSQCDNSSSYNATKNSRCLFVRLGINQYSIESDSCQSKQYFICKVKQYLSSVFVSCWTKPCLQVRFVCRKTTNFNVVKKWIVTIVKWSTI